MSSFQLCSFTGTKYRIYSKPWKPSKRAEQGNQWWNCVSNLFKPLSLLHMLPCVMFLMRSVSMLGVICVSELEYKYYKLHPFALPGLPVFFNCFLLKILWFLMCLYIPFYGFYIFHLTTFFSGFCMWLVLLFSYSPRPLCFLHSVLAAINSDSEFLERPF